MEQNCNLWFVEELESALQTCTGDWVVIDFYDCPSDVVYDGNSLEDAKYAKRERIIDTYGECYCKILRRAD